MKKFLVCFTESVSYEVTIECDNEIEAERIVNFCEYPPNSLLETDREVTLIDSVEEV